MCCHTRGSSSRRDINVDDHEFNNLSSSSDIKSALPTPRKERLPLTSLWGESDIMHRDDPTKNDEIEEAHRTVRYFEGR